MGRIRWPVESFGGCSPTGDLKCLTLGLRLVLKPVTYNNRPGWAVKGPRVVGAVAVNALVRLRVISVSVAPIGVASLDPLIIRGVIESEIVIVLKDFKF